MKGRRKAMQERARRARGGISAGRRHGVETTTRRSNRRVCAARPLHPCEIRADDSTARAQAPKRCAWARPKEEKGSRAAAFHARVRALSGGARTPSDGRGGAACPPLHRPSSAIRQPEQSPARRMGEARTNRRGPPTVVRILCARRASGAAMLRDGGNAALSRFTRAETSPKVLVRRLNAKPADRRRRVRSRLHARPSLRERRSRRGRHLPKGESDRSSRARSCGRVKVRMAKAVGADANREHAADDGTAPRLFGCGSVRGGPTASAARAVRARRIAARTPDVRYGGDSDAVASVTVSRAETR